MAAISLTHPTLQASVDVAVIDDVVTTARSTMVAVNKLREAGFIVEHAFCVVDREDAGRQVLSDEGIALHALFQLSELAPGAKG